MDGCRAILRPFQWCFNHNRTMKGDNNKLYAMRPRLWLDRFPLPTALELETCRSVSQRLTY